MTALDTGASFDDWVAELGEAAIPVLRDTVSALESLKAREDEVTARELSEAILRDPMLTLSVLRFLQVNRPSRRIVDITTIEHGVMMLGIGPFFRHFRDFAVVEDALNDSPPALRGLQAVISRARHAAAHARHWAALRGDVETDEVAIAALLHDLAEMLLWMFAPQAAMRIAERMQRDTSLRSASAQQQVLGFGLDQLQQALCRAWQLPELLFLLMDEQQAHRPRAQNVLLAVALARHAAHGWWDAALPSDYEAITAFLRLPKAAVMEDIFRTSLGVATQQAYSDTRCAAWLPPPPVLLNVGVPPAEGAGSGQDVVERAMERLAHIFRTRLDDSAGTWPRIPASRLVPAHALAVAMHAMHVGLGADRVVFLEYESDCLTARFVAGERSAASLRECRMFARPDQESWAAAVQARIGHLDGERAITVPVRRGRDLGGVIYAAGASLGAADYCQCAMNSIVAAVEAVMA